MFSSYQAVGIWGTYAPFKVMRSKKGKIVVSETKFKEWQRGDIILKVGDSSIDEMIKEKTSYIATSNPSTLDRDIWGRIHILGSSPIVYTIECNGKKQEITVGHQLTMTGKTLGRRTPESYGLANKNIGCIDINATSADSIKKILSKNKKGIVLDMRIYPQMDAFQTLVLLLTDKAYAYVWFSTNMNNQSGNYKFKSEYKTIENAEYYKGKVAILVNEGTQSHGEFSAMAYRKAPNSVIIGSQTAGADGNIQTFYLSGDISVAYTGLGTYYPDWEMCQRIGLKIDVPIRPTASGIKEGRDELLEEAIKYIFN